MMSLSFAAKRRETAAAEASALAEAERRRRDYWSGVREEKRDAITIAKAMAVEQLHEKGVHEYDAEDLFSDLNEKLDDDSDLDALEGYSLIDIVSFLCAQIGLPFDPAHWDDDEALRQDWLTGEPDPPPKPPEHAAWVIAAKGPP